MSGSTSDRTGIGSGLRTRLSARPPAMRGYPYPWLVVFLAFMIALRFIPNWANDGALTFNFWMIYTVMVVGFYFVFGVSGQFAFSQAAFAMVGGYVSNWATRQGVTFLLAVCIGVAVACVIAFLFAVLARRANLFFLAIATLALSEILNVVVQQWTQFTGNSGGELVGVKPIVIFGWTATKVGDTAGNTKHVFWVYLAALGLVLLLGIWLARSPAQREAIAMRDQPTVATTVGVPTLRVRLMMFVMGSGVGAFAGALYIHGNGYGQPGDFTVELALGIFVMLIVGGAGSLWGPILGAAFYVWVPFVLQSLNVSVFGHQLREYNQIIYGVALLVTMVFMPSGLIGAFHALKAKVQGRTPPERRTWFTDAFGITRPAPEPVPVVDEAVLPAVSAEARARAVVSAGKVEGDVILQATDLRVRFGGVKAVDGVTLDLRHGEILGLVGPNGSGKTTFLNALTGVVPASGRLEVAGRDVRLGIPGRARAFGLLRTYQAPQTYDHLSCLEDVLVSTSDRRLTGIAAAWLLRPFVRGRERVRWGVAVDALERVGLVEFAETPAARLTYGQRRLLELARAIAAGPSVLLLDEPSAGLDQSETEQLGVYLHQLRREGVSLLVIDHKLDFITHLCDRVAVLEQGHLVAVGDAATVFEDQRVVDAYLGVAEVD